MATYKVVFEIEVDADSPLEAAKETQEIMNEKKNSFQFYVQEHNKKEIHSIDLYEDTQEIVEYKPLIKK